PRRHLVQPRCQPSKLARFRGASGREACGRSGGGAAARFQRNRGVMAQWGRERNLGLIVVPDPATNAHRKLINELAARQRLPVIHAWPAAAAEGGLMSYGVDLPNVFRQPAAYADRILKGATPADLPIFLPTKLVINLTTAKTLGIDVPLALMVRADELLD